MAHIQDRWYKTVTRLDGETYQVPKDRCGRGQRYIVVWTAEDGSRKKTSFAELPQAQQFMNGLNQPAARIGRGRHARGSDHGLAKLTETQVVQIRERYASGKPTDSIAAAFGVTAQNINAIASGRTWKDAGGPITVSRPRLWRDGGRQLAAIRQSNGKLTEAQVTDIRARYAAGETQVALAAEFGVGQSAISKLISGQSWRATAA